MNNTNRAMNRLFIAAIGLLLLAGGILLVLGSTIPRIGTAWATIGAHLTDTMTGWLRAEPLRHTSTSWLWIPLLLVLAVIIAVLVVFIARHGRGRTRTLLVGPMTGNGRVVVGAAVAEQSLQQALDSQPEMLSAHVSTFKVHHTAALKISVTTRRGTSPREVTDKLEESVRALDALLGTELPVLIQLTGGTR